MQPKLAARVRLLHTGNTGKSDPNDACCGDVGAADGGGGGGQATLR